MMHFAAVPIANPEFNRVCPGVFKGEPFAVGGPDRRSGADTRRKGDMYLRSVREFQEHIVVGAGSDAVSTRRRVIAAVAGLDAIAGEAKKRLRHAGDRRILDPGDQEHLVARRAQHGLRRRRSVQDVEDVLRRLVVCRS